MQLQLVTPKTLVDGFSVSVARRNESIVANDLFADLVIDYYIELRVQYDGSNTKYGTEKYEFPFLISQLTAPCNCKFKSGVPLIMLSHLQQLASIRVQEATYRGVPSALLFVQTTPGLDKGQNPHHYQLRRALCN